MEEGPRVSSKGGKERSYATSSSISNLLKPPYLGSEDVGISGGLWPSVIEMSCGEEVIAIAILVVFLFWSKEIGNKTMSRLRAKSVLFFKAGDKAETVFSD